MSSESPTKKAKESADATLPAVSGGGIHFTPELIASMATFADANFSPDAMNICLAVGPDVSRTIKHFYLRRNERYLIDTLKNLIVSGNESSRRERAGTNHTAWMEVNTDWKTTAVSDDGMTRSAMPKARTPGFIYPFSAFNNAAVALELGLLEVVKFLIEDKGVDPNEYMYSRTLKRGASARIRVHLVSAAMTSRQGAIFQYLLSLPSIDLYSEIDDDRHRSRDHGLFEQALDVYVVRDGAKVFLTSIVNHNQFDVNRACHRYSTYATSDFTCLGIALYKLQAILLKFEIAYCHSGDEVPDLTPDDSESLERHINAVKILLEAGANLSQSVSDGLESGIAFVEERLLNVGYYSNPLLIETVYGRVLAMMREPRAT